MPHWLSAPLDLPAATIDQTVAFWSACCTTDRDPATGMLGWLG